MSIKVAHIFKFLCSICAEKKIYFEQKFYFLHFCDISSLFRKNSTKSAKIIVHGNTFPARIKKLSQKAGYPEPRKNFSEVSSVNASVQRALILLLANLVVTLYNEYFENEKASLASLLQMCFSGYLCVTLCTDGVGQDVKIARVTRHPSWNSATLSDDICILKLSQPVQYSR
jgi:hypothetical protein